MKYRDKYRGGLLVVNVRLNSPARQQGIRAGDVLVGLHIWETVSLANVKYTLDRPNLPAMNPLKFFVLRDGETLYGYLNLPALAAHRQYP